MPITPVFVKTAGAPGSSSPAVTAGQDTTGCNLLVAAAASYNGDGGGAVTFTDNQANTWHPVAAEQTPDASRRIQFFWCKAPTTNAAHTFTATPAGGGYVSLVVRGYSAPDAFLDQVSSASAASAISLDGGPATPRTNDQLVIAALCTADTNAPTIDSSFTIAGHIEFDGATHESVALAEKILTGGSGTALDPTYTRGAGTASGMAVAVISFSPTALPSGVNIKLNCGGASVSGWLNDASHLISVSSAASFGDTPSTTGLVNPAPTSVYSTARVEGSAMPEYQFDTTDGLVANGYYLVRTHHNCANASHVIGIGVANVVLNGVIAMPRYGLYAADKYFDIFEEAGGAHKGLIREYIAQADSSGVLKVKVNGSVNNTNSDVHISGLEIKDAPPIASATVTPPSDQTGNAAFTDTSLNTPTSWHWDFGDGNTSALQNPTHHYAAAGTYYVTLVATNATGDSEPYALNAVIPSATALTVTPATMPDVHELLAYHQDILATGGTGPYTSQIVAEAATALDYYNYGTNLTGAIRRGLPNGLIYASNAVSGTADLTGVIPLNVVLGGDSLTRGFGPGGGDPAYTATYAPHSIAAQNLPKGSSVTNAAVTGQSLASMDALYTTAFFAAHFKAGMLNVFHICGGENDLILFGTALSSMEATLQAIVSRAVAGGYVVSVGDLITNPNLDSTTQAKSAAFSTFIATTLSGAADRIHWESNYKLSHQAHNKYFLDGGIHFTERGYIERGLMIGVSALAASASATAIAGNLISFFLAAKAQDSLGNAHTQPYTLNVLTAPHLPPSTLTEGTGMTEYRAGSNVPMDAASRIRPAIPKPIYTFTNPAADLTWSDGGAGGTFDTSGTDDVVAIYTPYNRTQQVIITATDGLRTLSLPLLVYGTIPVQPQFGFDLEYDRDTKVKFAKDRTRYFREDGDTELTWVLAWEKRMREDKDELVQFWREHRKVVPFYMVDVEGNVLNRVWFNSSLKTTSDGANRFAMAATLIGVDEETPVTV